MKLQRSIRSEPNFFASDGIRKQRKSLNFTYLFRRSIIAASKGRARKPLESCLNSLRMLKSP
ncbi:hypothetical protein CKA34_25095 (plasmid) [Rhizobium sp. 11515TR]|nr:hypothetical protein CKA34_25095 [Rhizobium sp. 11515TR]